MYKQCFLCDSDALIKLMKASILKTFAEHFQCTITKEIEKEVVTAGKKSMYSDAEEIEALIEKKIITVKDVEDQENYPLLERCGKGEISLYSLQKKEKEAIIISDDKTFIKKIREEQIEFITPSDCIKLAFELEIIDKKSALEKLKNMKPYISEMQYQTVKNDIGD